MSEKSAHEAERQAAKKMDLRNQSITLAVAAVAFFLSLVLPYAGSAHGWEALLLGVGSEGVKISLMEVVAAWLRLLGLGILTPLTLLTHRTNLGLVAWMMVTVAFFISLWGFWFRGSTGDGPGIGMWLAVVASGAAFLAYSLVALRRSPAQQEAEARARAAAGELDSVARLQSEVAFNAPAEENPLLVDDRRRQAAARHRHQD